MAVERQSACRVQHGLLGATMGMEALTTGTHGKKRQARVNLLFSASPHHIPLDSHQHHPPDCSLHGKAVDQDLQM